MEKLAKLIRTYCQGRLLEGVVLHHYDYVYIYMYVYSVLSIIQYITLYMYISCIIYIYLSIDYVGSSLPRTQLTLFCMWFESWRVCHPK